MPLKYYTDLGFYGEQIVATVTGENGKHSALGTLYRVDIEIFKDVTFEGTKRSETMIASPKRKSDANAAGRDGAKKPQIVVANLDPEPSKWTLRSNILRPYERSEPRWVQYYRLQHCVLRRRWRS